MLLGLTVIDEPVAPPGLHRYVNGPVPLETLAVSVPELPEQMAGLFTVTAGGELITTAVVLVAAQPFRV